MDYDKKIWSEFALKVLEGDVQFLARRYHIKGYEFEDLCQELRMHLWRKISKYDPRISGIRTWANAVMRNRLKDLLKAQDYSNNKSFSVSIILPPEEIIEIIERKIYFW